MIFLELEDFESHIGEGILQQIIDSDETLLDKAEKKAIGIIKDLLSGMYDLDHEFDQVEDNRHQTLLLWTLVIAAYQLYRRIPDTEVPERIIKEHDDVMKTLEGIGRGKLPTTLKPIESESGVVKRVFRMGSSKPRGHNAL